MKKVLIAIIFIGGLLWSVERNDMSGSASLQFLKLGKSAKAVALGDAYSAIPGDISAIFYNPAGVYGVLQWEATAVYTRLFTANGANLLNLAGKYKAGDIGDFGLGLSLLLPGSQTAILYQNGDLVEGATFNTASFEVILNYSKGLINENLTLGLNIKTAVENVGGADDGQKISIPKFVSDIGLIFNFGLINPVLSTFNFGFSANQLGLPEKYSSGKYPMPFTIKSGLSYLWWINSDHELLFVGEAEKVFSENFTFTLGTRYTLKKMLDVSVGYKIGDGLYGINVGGGIGIRDFRVSYSFDFAEFDVMHRVEIEYGMPVKEKPVSVEALYFAGQKYFGRKEYDRAEDYFNKALAIEPDHAKSLERIEEIKDLRLKAKRLKAFEQAMTEIK